MYLYKLSKVKMNIYIYRIITIRFDALTAHNIYIMILEMLEAYQINSNMNNFLLKINLISIRMRGNRAKGIHKRLKKWEFQVRIVIVKI